MPLIVKLPKTNKSQVVEAQVRTTDILPTILDLLAIEAPAELSGSSLQAYISKAGGADRVAFGETDYPLRFGWAPLRSRSHRRRKVHRGAQTRTLRSENGYGRTQERLLCGRLKSRKIENNAGGSKGKAGGNLSPEAAQLPRSQRQN